MVVVVVVVMMVIVMMMICWRAEKTPRDVGRARGVWWGCRGATVSRGGRLVVHGRERLVVGGGQREGRGAWGGWRGRDEVRLGQMGAGMIV